MPVVSLITPTIDRTLQGFEGEYSIFIQPVRKLNAETASTMPPAFQQHVLPFFKVTPLVPNCCLPHPDS